MEVIKEKYKICENCVYYRKYNATLGRCDHKHMNRTEALYNDYCDFFQEERRKNARSKRNERIY